MLRLFSQGAFATKTSYQKIKNPGANNPAYQQQAQSAPLLRPFLPATPTTLETPPVPGWGR